MTEAIRAWLLAQLGATTDLIDLEQRYARLGTARTVAIEVLYERIAKLRAQPASVNLSSVVSVSYSENIKAYERQIAALEAGQPPAPDDPAADPAAGDIGVIRLIERPRR
ncbi:hypothetical protein [Streptomyces sp. NBC_01353]|uniref:hypothetical protein n=1 Tax=Streptomyces sp. NBC_01353 TaxID=2903835 RepID=UPI002E3180C4|nr:hypothetical protein [Streptomyces sp. NBC_01353]